LLFTFYILMFVFGCENVLCLILNPKALNQQCQANNLIIKNLY